MFQTATLVAHRGAILISRKELARYEAPEATATWKPVKHSVLVDLMHEELGRRHIGVTKEEYAIQRDGNCLFAALTTNWLESGETAAALAFRHSNDKTQAMKMYAGVRVFICDNMALSGDEIILNRKHTTRLNVAEDLAQAFDRYNDGALMLQRNIEDLKGGLLPDISVASMLFEIFYQRILPARMLVPVANSFYSQHERTGWALLNACTLHAKNLPPSGNMRAHTRLGRYFGLGRGNPLNLKKGRRWLKALRIAKILFEDQGYHTRYLTELELLVEGNMYTPSLRPDQIHKLYLLRRLRKKPMSRILRQIVDEYLENHAEELKGVEVVTKQCIEIRRAG